MGFDLYGMMMSERIKIILGYIIISLIWGSTWLAIRLGLDSLTPLIASGLRFLVASLFIYLFMKYKKVELQKDSLSIKLYFFLGVFSYFIPFGLVYWAEQFVPSGLASVIFATFPFMVMLFTFLFLKTEVIDKYKFLGAVAGFVGIYFIFSDEIKIDLNFQLWGMIAILSSSILQALSAVMIKKYGKHLNPISMNFLPVLIGGLFLISSGMLLEDFSKIIFDKNAAFSVFYLAFFGTLISFTIYYWLLKKINIVILSLSSFITPIIAIFLGWLILSEKFQQNDYIGTIFVLIGLLIANSAGIINFSKSKRI